MTFIGKCADRGTVFAVSNDKLDEFFGEANATTTSDIATTTTTTATTSNCTTSGVSANDSNGINNKLQLKNGGGAIFSNAPVTNKNKGTISSIHKNGSVLPAEKLPDLTD